MKESTFEGVGGLKIFTRSWQPEGKTRGVMASRVDIESRNSDLQAMCSRFERYLVQAVHRRVSC